MTRSILLPPLPFSEASDRRPLFLPLKAEWFDAFEKGEKGEEYRAYGTRFNEVTCTVGRSVVLSYGYGKKRRLQGKISFFRTAPMSEFPVAQSIYPDHDLVAIIGIELQRSKDAAHE